MKILKNIVIAITMMWSIESFSTRNDLFFYKTGFSYISFKQFNFNSKVETPSAYHVCFTPGGNCTNDIVIVLNSAKKTIYVQAYSFTSAPIAKALVDAKAKGIDVQVILDKSQFKAEKYSSSKFLANHGIHVWIDYRPAISHNKIMIIDDSLVITGSFNFTKAAQEKNAENSLMIYNKELAADYLENWKKRQSESIYLANYHPEHRGLHKNVR